jgi:Holliday junction resolvase RusA-like endonuclease
MTIVIPGRIPSKKNSKQIVQIAGRPRLISSKQHREWHELQSWALKKYVPKQPIARATIQITFFAENRRRWDLTNSADSVMDLLVDMQILADDGVANVPALQLLFGGVEQENPRAEVEINGIT